MRHGSLFSGIGGFDLAAEWMGWENVFHCEWNEFNKKILKHYWPDATSYSDITKTDFSIHRGTIDIITGGFPCQPYSAAGKRKGKEDDRHLWPEMLRAIREVQPGWVVGENVPGLLNWNGGMVLNEIKVDLEGEGFEVFPPCVLPACGLNANHKRDRLWIVAYSDGIRKRELQTTSSREEKKKVGNENSYRPDGIFKNGITSDTDTSRRQERREQWKSPIQFAQNNRLASEPGICRGVDGIPYRVDRLKALGNAIVPQVVFEIFKAIELMLNSGQGVQVSDATKDESSTCSLINKRKQKETMSK